MASRKIISGDNPLPRKSTKIWTAAIALTGLAVYWSGLHNPLVYDDVAFLGANEALRIPRNLLLLWTRDYFTISAGGSSYRPLTVMIWAIDMILFKNNSFGIHLSSLLLHLANSCLVYKVGKDLLLSEEAAAFGGLLFAVHPVHTEAINCVALNGDPLATLFTLLALGGYLRMRRNSGSGSWPAIRLTVYFAMALLSKEAALVLPPLLVLYEFLRLGPAADVRSLRRAWSGICAATAVYLWLRFGPLRSPLESHRAYIAGSFLNNLMTDLQLPARYLGLLLWPQPLSIFHDVRFITRWNQWELWYYGATIIALGWSLVRLFGHSRRDCFFAAWIVVGLLPLLNLIPFFSLKIFFSERFLYLPSVGFCWLAATGWERLRGRRPGAAVGVAIALVLVLSLKTRARNLDWRSDDVLLKQAQDSGAAPYLANFLQGSAHLAQGRPDQAARELELALPAAPDRIQANIVRQDLGVAFVSSGRCQESVAVLSQALAKGGLASRLHADLGTAYYCCGNGPMAAQNLEMAVAAEPDNAGMHFNLAAAYKMSGEAERAGKELRLARGLNPNIKDVKFWIAAEN